MRFEPPTLGISSHCSYIYVHTIKPCSAAQVHPRSVDPQKLYNMCIAINYTPPSMAYYFDDSTANSLSLGATVKKRHCDKVLSYVVLEILNLNH